MKPNFVHQLAEVYDGTSATAIDMADGERTAGGGDDELPEGWAIAALPDIALMRLGKMLDKGKQSSGPELPYLRNVNVRWGEFELGDLLSMRFSVKEAQEFSIRDGDVLVCEGGEPGRAAVWNSGPTEIKFQKALHRIRANEAVDPNWLAIHFRYCATSGALEEFFTGSTIKHLTGIALRRASFRIPPLPEQRRIVVKVEELLARVQTTRERLARAAASVKRFRQSILAAACDGRLTEDWRETQSQGEWDTSSVGSILAEPLSNGRSVVDAVEGFPVLRLSCLRRGLIDLSERKTGRWTREQASRFMVKQGDFFVARGNGSLALVGCGGALTSEPDDVAFPDTMIRLRLDSQSVLLNYFALVWNSPVVRHQIEDRARTSAGIYKISQKDIQQIEISLPPLTEQHEIVRRVDALFKLADAIGGRIVAATARVERLTQAILAKAFRGELVPTEADLARAEGRTYETAEQLLARIQAEVPAPPQDKKATRRKRATRAE